jgi:hypothetical protein
MGSKQLKSTLWLFYDSDSDVPAKRGEADSAKLTVVNFYK